MRLDQLFLVALGLSMDAFAVAVCKGLALRQWQIKNALIVALFFGGFQAFMPIAGYFLGTQFKGQISSFSHIVAFILLAMIGISMLKESFEKNKCVSPSIELKAMIVLATATSIDALVAGVSLAFLSVNIWAAVLSIGIITFIMSFFGVKIGNVFGCKYKSISERAGGIILIFMGIKILLEHFGIFS